MTHGLRKAVLSLGAANAIDYALQFLLPVILTRFLDPAEFGGYRLFWLVATTAVALTSLGIPQSLYFFLPRSDSARKRLYVYQAMTFLGIGGLLAALAILPGSPLLPKNAQILAQSGLLPSAFVVLWGVSNLLDVFPAADGRPHWQAKTIVGLSAARALLLGVTAMLTGSLSAVLWALMAFVTLKLCLLMAYMMRYHGLGGPYAEQAAFREQTSYAIPFGIAGMLFGLRSQVEQWVAATLFTIGQFADFSVAAVLGPLVSLFRQSMNQAFLPRMSELHSEGNAESMLDLNNRANVALALLLFPLLAFAFVFSHSLISLIYTDAYAKGGDVMRVYVLGMIALSVEVNNVMLLLQEGRFTTRINLITLCVCVVASLAFAKLFGLAGAAMGSVAAVYIERLITLRRIGARMSLPLSALQNWPALAKILLSATIAALVAWAAISAMPLNMPLAAWLGLAGVVVSIAYFLMLLALGMRTTLFALVVRVR